MQPALRVRAVTRFSARVPEEGTASATSLSAVRPRTASQSLMRQHMVPHVPYRVTQHRGGDLTSLPHTNHMPLHGEACRSTPAFVGTCQCRLMHGGVCLRMPVVMQAVYPVLPLAACIAVRLFRMRSGGMCRGGMCCYTICRSNSFQVLWSELHPPSAMLRAGCLSTMTCSMRRAAWIVRYTRQHALSGVPSGMRRAAYAERCAERHVLNSCFFSTRSA